MRRLIFVLLAIIIVVAAGTYFLMKPGTVTGEVIASQYSFTKAICDDNNRCQDYKIVCEGNRTIEITPITGAVVQHDLDWEDPRSEEEKNKLCG